MSKDRIDTLLDQALVTGEIPADATAAERAEIEELLRGAGALGGLRAAVEAEARASQPTARARFQRHMEAETVKAAPVSRPAVVAAPGQGFLGRLFAFHRGLTLAGSVAAVALLVAVAAVASQSYGGVQTASALVLNDNDYAQVQGVVSGTSGEGANRKVTIRSDFGELEVAVTEATTVGGQGVAALKPGDAVTVEGTVSKRQKVTAIAAASLAVATEPKPTPDAPKVKELRKGSPPVEGTISVFTVSGDGRFARVLIDPGSGEHVVVRVGAESLGRLMAANSAPIGLRVRVTHEASSPAGEFSLTVINPPQATPPPGATRTPESAIRGTFVGRQLNVARVKTDRGEISVVLRAETRIVIGPGAGLTVKSVREGDSAVGHEVALQGFVDRATGRFVAEVIWVGAKVTQ